MCSWCWGFSNSYDKLIAKLDDKIEVVRVLGGLAPDSEEAMTDATKLMVKNAWHQIDKIIPDIRFNFDYWQLNTPRRSTYPACRAVIAAREQGQQFDLIMTKAIQTAYYKKAQNPSDIGVLIRLARDIGLDEDLFIHDIKSSKIEKTLLAEIKYARSLKANSFPSLVLKKDQSFNFIAIDYLDVNTMLESINK